MATCPNCGRELPEGTKFCGYCGATLENAQPAAAPYTPPTPTYNYSQQPVSTAGYGVAPQGQSKAKSIVGMILSIAALAFAITGLIFSIQCAPSVDNAINIAYSYYSSGSNMFAMAYVFGGLAIALGIPGLILSCKGRRNPAGRGMGTAGKIMGIFAIVLGGITIVLTSIFIAVWADM